MTHHIGVLAGVASTVVFVLSALPMLSKAARTRNLASYSGSNLVLANVGNATQTAYVLTLPPGPLWVLHAFNTAASALMLTWWLRAACAARAATTAPLPTTTTGLHQRSQHLTSRTRSGYRHDRRQPGGASSTTQTHRPRRSRDRREHAPHQNRPRRPARRRPGRATAPQPTYTRHPRPHLPCPA